MTTKLPREIGYARGLIYLAAGGTGGHVFPATALYEALKESGYEVKLLTDERGARFLDSSFEVRVINFKYDGKDKLNKVKLFLRIFTKTYETIKLFYKTKPKAVVGFGGYQSVPALYAAFILNIPFVLYEPNSILGKANRLFKNFAKKVFVTDSSLIEKENIQANKYLLISPLVRSSILAIKKNIKDDAVFKIFIFGGSQSASVFSKIVPESIKLLPQGLKLYITQQANASDKNALIKFYKERKIPCRVREFFSDIAEIYASTDLVISRSGASTIAELCAINVPAILIPYPYATDNHQLHNARAMENQGRAICIEQKDLSPQILADKITFLIQNNKAFDEKGEVSIKTQKSGAKTFVDTLEKIIK